MTKDEALDLALEALEETLKTLDDANAIPGGPIADTIWYSPYETLFDYLEMQMAAIKQFRSAPVQEPVALVIDGVLVKSSLPEKYTGHLYTTPPAAQRQWVGLTDEEIDKTPCELYAPDQGGMTVEEGLELYARAIEAKLKEKNTL